MPGASQGMVSESFCVSILKCQIQKDAHVQADERTPLQHAFLHSETQVQFIVGVLLPNLRGCQVSGQARV